MVNMWKRALVPALVLVLVPRVWAGKLEKGFEALSMHDYFLARKLFQAEVDKHPAAAWYGLSVISGRADNPFYQLDSAYAYLLRAEVTFGLADDRERMRIKPLGVDQDAIVAQREHIHSVAWDLTKAQNTIAAYDRFLAQYERSTQAEEARLVRDHLAFQEAREVNTSTAYQEFLDRFPRSRQVYEARGRLQEAIFREATAEGTIASHQRFIADHGDSPYVEQAEDAIYALSTPRGTQEELAAFIHDFPKNHRVPEAWRALYTSYTRDLDADAITQFLKDHPDYPFIQELVEDYRVASQVLLPFRRNGLWGFIDDQGVERIKAEYEWVEPFVNGQALVGRSGREGTIDRSGKEVISVDHDEVSEHSEGLAVVERAGKVGVASRTGELVVPMEFEEIGEHVGGLAYASAAASTASSMPAATR
ncbi:MAG: WG repeat-containing protein [Flavobacteriales bacterium]|nr:WG repeat-containing protein [Flavobacteriales bacterium]